MTNIYIYQCVEYQSKCVRKCKYTNSVGFQCSEEQWSYMQEAPMALGQCFSCHMPMVQHSNGLCAHKKHFKTMKHNASSSNTWDDPQFITMRSKSCAGTQNDEIQISHPIMWTSDGQQENDNKTKIRATATTMATNIEEISKRHRWDIIQTSCRHHLDIIQTSFRHDQWHHPDIIQTSSFKQHPCSWKWCENKK